jgi:hypothetical protein
MLTPRLENIQDRYVQIMNAQSEQTAPPNFSPQTPVSPGHDTVGRSSDNCNHSRSKLFFLPPPSPLIFQSKESAHVKKDGQVGLIFMVS